MGLFLAIRGRDWYLRTACVKQMAPVFTEFDNANYHKLIYRHLADLPTMPQSVLTTFEQGAFVDSITGRMRHAVAIMKRLLIKHVNSETFSRPHQQNCSLSTLQDKGT